MLRRVSSPTRSTSSNGSHGVVQPELQRLVDIAGRGDAFHQHVERLVAEAGVHARRDEAGRFRTSTVSFPIRATHLDCLERRRRCSRALHDLDELHLVDRVEEVHAGDPSRVLQRRRPAR